MFFHQVIFNKSRAQHHAMVSKIPIQIDDLAKIPQISNDIENMLRLNSNIFLKEDAPYCFLSRVESSFAELTFGCNLNHMVSFIFQIKAKTSDSFVGCADFVAYLLLRFVASTLSCCSMSMFSLFMFCVAVLNVFFMIAE